VNVLALTVETVKPRSHKIRAAEQRKTTHGAARAEISAYLLVMYATDWRMLTQKWLLFKLVTSTVIFHVICKFDHVRRRVARHRIRRDRVNAVCWDVCVWRSVYFITDVRTFLCIIGRHKFHQIRCTLKSWNAKLFLLCKFNRTSHHLRRRLSRPPVHRTLDGTIATCF